MSATLSRAGAVRKGAKRAAGLHPVQRGRILSYALLLPATAAVLCLIVYPLLRVVELSFREGRTMNFAKIGSLPLGLGNYEKVLADPAFWGSAWTSTVYVTLSVVLAFLVGLGTALLLDRDLPFRRVLRTAVLLPWAIPGVIVSIVFLWMLDGSFGVVNAMLRDLGLLETDHAWFADGSTALLAVVAPTVWKAYPLITLTLLAAMQSVPAELYEAAEIDGAGAFGRFAFVTWPGIRAAALLATMISALWIFRDVDIVFATTGGGPVRATETLAIYVYHEAFNYFRMGTAAAVGTVMIAVALGVALASVGLARRSRF